MGVNASLCQDVSGLQHLAVGHLDPGSVGDQIGLGIARLVIRHDDLAFFLCILNGHDAAELSDDRQSLGPSGLKQLLDTGKTLCDVAAGHAAGMEGTHGQLSTRLTDGLSSDNADRLADLDRLARRHVGAVALGADADVALTGKNGTDLYGIPSQLLQNLDHSGRALRRTHMVGFHHHFSRIGIRNGFGNISSCETLLQALDGFFSIGEAGDLHIRDIALALAAVGFPDDQILGYVYQTSRQITGVRRTKGRIGQTLSGAVSGNEVFQYVQSLTEIGLDRKLDGMSRRIRHQSAHSGQLLDLLIGASGSGVRHHEDVVVFIKTCQQVVGQLVVGGLPGIDHFFIALLLGDQTAAEVSGNLIHRRFRVRQKLLLRFRNGHVGNRNRHRRPSGIFIADGLDIVQGNGGLDRAVGIDNLLQDLL